MATTDNATTTMQPGRAAPHISSFLDKDLGFKIGVKYGSDKTKMGFVPILGWATISNYADAGVRAFAPVICDSNNMPTLASPSTVLGFAGVFRKQAIVDDLAGMSDPKERPV
jgi:hypothetical protein